MNLSICYIIFINLSLLSILAVLLEMFSDWKSTTFILCSYGFFKEIRPSEPFLTEYLIGNSTGLTASQLYQDVYPIWTYSYLAVLVIVFLFTDLVRLVVNCKMRCLSYYRNPNSTTFQQKNGFLHLDHPPPYKCHMQLA